MTTQPTPKTGSNFTVVDLGNFSELDQFTFEIPINSRKIEGKVFLKELLNLTSAEISVNKLPPGKSIPFYHKHRLNEETYLFICGNGEFQIDDLIFPVTEGTVVRVDPDGERCLRNVSQTEELCWIVIQSRINSQPDYAIQDGFAVEKRVSWFGKQSLNI